MDINDLKDVFLDSGTRPASSYTKGEQIKNYLRENSIVFKELDDLRIEGWTTASGDVYFKKQRKKADEASFKQGKIFFRLMQAIGDEIQEKTGTLRILHEKPKVLDLCMAPGGYTQSALKYNESARVFGITLPAVLGGHPLLCKGDLRVKVVFEDITMFAAEFGIEQIPSDHPDREKFWLDSRPHFGLVADLIFCDGQVLRTHAEHRKTYRESSEAERLIYSQLVLALQRIRTGGTLVILLHKADRFDTVVLLKEFDSFADVQLFKPKCGHVKRSSFYLIATNVRPEHAAAVAAKRRWIEIWKAATFGAEGTDSDLVTASTGEKMEDILADFGERLIGLAEPVWRTQAAALKEAPWLRDRVVKPQKAAIPS